MANVLKKMGLLERVLRISVGIAGTWLIIYAGTGGFGKITQYDNALKRITLAERPIPWKEYSSQKGITGKLAFETKDLESLNKIEKVLESLEKRKEVFESYVELTQKKNNRWQERISVLDPPFLRQKDHAESNRYLTKYSYQMIQHREVQRRELQAYQKYFMFLREYFGYYKVSIEGNIFFNGSLLQKKYDDLERLTEQISEEVTVSLSQITSID